MAHIGHMNFFSVNECGLYKVGDDFSYGIHLNETFALIKDWIKDRPLSTTIPWDPTTKNKAKCYCREIEIDPNTGDFVVVLWKSETDSTGAIWGAEEDTANGSGEVYEYANEVKGKKIIWGRPCYYWVIPSLNTVVSIKFEHSLCDSQMFQDYVVECIRNRVKHPNKIKEQTEGGFVRFSFSDTSNHQKYSFRFDVSLRSLNTSDAELTNLVSKITHMVWRETIEVNVPDQRAEWIKKLNNSLPFVSAKPKSKKRTIEIKAEAKPTLAEVKEIIAKYARDNRSHSDWNNVGFATDKGITWVDRYRMKDSIALTDVKTTVLSAKYLLDALSKERNNFLKPLSKALENTDTELESSSNEKSYLIK